jgi:uncharacterized membrane protein
MNNFHLFDYLPLWITFLCIIAIILLSAWSGVSFVRRRKKSIVEDEGPLNTIVGANLALLAFILAFTFGLTTTRFDERKLFMLEEVNSIETTWYRAGLTSEPQSSEIKELLKEYARFRTVLAKQPERVKEVLIQSEIIHHQIWSIVTELVNLAPRNDAINALLVESVNELFDNHTKRVTVTLSHRIPLMIWVALFALVMFSMFTVGYLLGKMENTNWYMILALSLAFTAVILIIIALDSTSGGAIQLNHQPMFDLYQRLLDG